MPEIPLMEIRRLKKHFPAKGGRDIIRAVDDVSLAIAPGEILGLAGESGSGKTTLGRTLLRLYEPTAGQIFYRGVSVFDSGGFPAIREDGVETVSRPVAAEMRPYRRKLQMIFQDSYGALDPHMTAEESISEAIDILRLAQSRGERTDRVGALLSRVGLGSSCAGRYPHELSGGQRQRVGIARALAAEPEFLVCDEPVSALDVSVQAQILSLLLELRERLGLTYLLIAHDLSVVRRISDRIGILYRGRLVELAGAEELCGHPAHPYTKLLLGSMPVSNPSDRRGRSGGPAGLATEPPPCFAGCGFYPRCPSASPGCALREPVLREVSPGHSAACHIL